MLRKDINFSHYISPGYRILQMKLVGENYFEPINTYENQLVEKKRRINLKCNNEL